MRADLTPLLTYHLDVTPSPKGVPTGFTSVRLPLGEGHGKQAEWPIRCTRVSVAFDVGFTRTSSEPISVHTSLTPVSGRDQGRRWWTVANTTDPARVVVDCVPEDTASFDGTWSVTVTIELDAPVADTVEVTEVTATATSDFATRTGTVPVTLRVPTP
ncbi:hypothetical protein [Actinoalloteichus caeruleus]|uniref:hypothetical protein n=1 Tax=Actinoalloteichus cyanogriseus TaxID=2893586 RepID=UPI003AB0A6DC